MGVMTLVETVQELGPQQGGDVRRKLICRHDRWLCVDASNTAFPPALPPEGSAPVTLAAPAPTIQATDQQHTGDLKGLWALE